MIFYLALLLIVLTTLLKTLYLLIKREALIVRLKKRSDGIRLMRGRFISVFLHDGKDDLIVFKDNKEYRVSILTTPFKRVRYHFDNNQAVFVYCERKAMFVQNYRVPNKWVGFDRVVKIRKYKISYNTDDDKTRFVIPHPAPRTISRVDKAKMESLVNNDVLFGSIKVCGAKYFIDEVLDN